MPNYEVTLIAFTTIAVENAKDKNEAIEFATDHVSSDFELHEAMATECKDTTDWENVKRCADHKCLD